MSSAPNNAVWKTIYAHLEQEMQRVRGEIQTYPAPIPACDAQFNHLLDEREALSSELTRVRELMARGGDSQDSSSVVDSFLNTSEHLDETAKKEIRTLIENDNP